MGKSHREIEIQFSHLSMKAKKDFLKKIRKFVIKSKNQDQIKLYNKLCKQFDESQKIIREARKNVK